MRTIRRGDNGPEVAAWQRIVGQTPDGQFGPATEASTKAWQAAHGLTPDGIVGALSWAAAGEPKPAKPLLRGVDVSVVQGDVSWDLVSKMGVDFAWIRCAVGNDSGRDPRFSQNVQGALSHGIVAGGYCFVYPLPHLDPRTQARMHVRKLERVGSRLGELLPAADLEWPPPEKPGQQPVVPESEWRRWGCSKEQIAEFCLEYLDEAFKLTGLRWARYSYRHWIDRVEFGRHPEFADGPLWLADYVSPGRVPTPEEAAARPVPLPWREITVIQHDGNGGLRMPNGVDADFNVVLGGRERLAELSAGAVAWIEPEAIAASAQVVYDDGVPDPIRDQDIAAYRLARIDQPG